MIELPDDVIAELDAEVNAWAEWLRSQLDEEPVAATEPTDDALFAAVLAELDKEVDDWADWLRASLDAESTEPVTAAEPWNPTWRARRAIPILRRAEKAIEEQLIKRFKRQQESSAKRIIDALTARMDVIAAAEPDYDGQMSDLVNGVFDTSLDADDIAVLRTQSQALANQAFLNTMQSIGMGKSASKYNIVAEDSVRLLRNDANALFQSVDDTTKRRIGNSLARGLRNGEHLDKLSARVNRILDDGPAWRARQIAQTETIRAYGKAAENTAKRIGVEQMQWVDGQLGACSICSGLNNKIRDIDGEYDGGYSNPPAHPGCRCAQIPYFGAEFEPLTPDEAALAIQYSMNDISTPFDLDMLKWQPYAGETLRVGDFIDMGASQWRVLKDPTEKSVRVVNLKSGRTGNAPFDKIKAWSRYSAEAEAQAVVETSSGVVEAINRIQFVGGDYNQLAIVKEALGKLPKAWVEGVDEIGFLELGPTVNGFTSPSSGVIRLNQTLSARDIQSTVIHEVVHIAERRGVISASLNKTLDDNFDRFMSVAKPVIPKAPTPISGALPFDLSKAKIQDGRYLGGAHSKKLITDDTGQQWMFKPAAGKPYQATAEAVEQSFAQAMGLAAPEVHIVEIEGQYGSLQRLMNVKTQGWKKGMAESLTDEQLIQLQKHQVIDWLFSQHDSNAGAPLFLADGRIAMIDKGQSFKFFGQDKLSPLYNPNKAFEPLMVYNDMWQTSNVRLQWANVEGFIRQVQAVDDKVLSEWLRPYLDDAVRSGVVPGGMTPGQFVNAMRMRKANLYNDFKDLYESYGADMLSLGEEHLKLFARLPIGDRPIRPYAISSAAEYRAETLAQYYINPDLLRNVDPRAFAAIDASFKSGELKNLYSFVARIRDYKPLNWTSGEHQAFWQAWANGLKTGKQAISKYQNSGHATLNRLLRNKVSKDSLPLETKRISNGLDKAFAAKNSIMNTDAILYRGMAPNDAISIGATTVGNIVEDLGYASSAMDYQTARGFGSAVFQLRTPAGHRIINVHQLNMKHSYEHELLFPRGTKMRIIEVQDGMAKWVEDIIGQNSYNKPTLSIIAEIVL